MYYVLGILGLALLMIVHEGGHLLAARAFGMRVLRFSIGFGPTIWRYQKSESDTIYQVALIPFLAYVQVAGMNPFEDNDPEDKTSYANASLVARIVTIFAGPFANYLFASLLFFATLAVLGREVAGREIKVLPTAQQRRPSCSRAIASSPSTARPSTTSTIWLAWCEQTRKKSSASASLAAGKRWSCRSPPASAPRAAPE